MSNPKGDHAAFFAQVMSHATTWRLSLRKGKGDQRVMKVVASPSKGVQTHFDHRMQICDAASTSCAAQQLYCSWLATAVLPAHVAQSLERISSVLVRMKDLLGAGEAEASFQIFTTYREPCTNSRFRCDHKLPCTPCGKEGETCLSAGVTDDSPD